MEKNRNVCISYDKALEWYNGDNKSLREIALQAFSEAELNACHFTRITTFEEACQAIGVSSKIEDMFKEYYTFKKSRASIASIKVNIIRQALNMGYKIDLTANEIWCPNNIFINADSDYFTKESAIEVAQFRYNNKVYKLFSAKPVNDPVHQGVGVFHSEIGVGFSNADIGFLGCTTKEIAEHMSKYFAKEIFEAKYGDFIDFKWIE